MFRLGSKFETAAAGGNEEAGRPEGSGFKLHTHDFILALDISGNLKCCTTDRLRGINSMKVHQKSAAPPIPPIVTSMIAVIVQIHDAVNRLAEELLLSPSPPAAMR